MRVGAITTIMVQVSVNESALSNASVCWREQEREYNAKMRR